MFNGGTAFSFDGMGFEAQLAVMNTILAGGSGGLTTFFTRKMITGQNKHIRMDFSGLTNGILAGLVSITAGCDCIEPWGAVVVGILGSFVYSLAVRLLDAVQVDDPLEAFQVHGACGFWGCLAVAFFKIDDGIFYGGENSAKLLWVQFYGCVVITLWSAFCSFIFAFISKKAGVLRLSDQDEILGGDLHYFGPIEFEGSVHLYDLEDNVEKMIEKSAGKMSESARDIELADMEGK